MLYAHSPNAAGVWQPLDEHLRNVAALAESFGSHFGAADMCHNAGILHDAGKAHSKWQDYLRQSHEGGRARARVLTSATWLLICKYVRVYHWARLRIETCRPSGAKARNSGATLCTP